MHCLYPKKLTTKKHNDSRATPNGLDLSANANMISCAIYRVLLARSVGTNGAGGGVRGTVNVGGSGN